MKNIFMAAAFLTALTASTLAQASNHSEACNTALLNTAQSTANRVATSGTPRLETSFAFADGTERYIFNGGYAEEITVDLKVASDCTVVSVSVSIPQPGN